MCQCRKFEENLAEASVEGASRSCGGGRGGGGSVLYQNCNQNLLDELQRLQKRALRICTLNPRLYPTALLHRQKDLNYRILHERDMHI